MYKRKIFTNITSITFHGFDIDTFWIIGISFYSFLLKPVFFQKIYKAYMLFKYCHINLFYLLI